MIAAVWQWAATLQAEFRRVSLADCFGLELAGRLNGVLLTADHHELDALAGRTEIRIRFIR